MTFQDIKTMIAGIGLAYTYHEWKCDPSDLPALPWIVFRYPDIQDFYADNQNYQRITTLEIELCTETKNFSIEAAVEDTLANNGLTYSKEENYFEADRMFDVIYTIEVIIS